jgi:hypothetical protein
MVVGDGGDDDRKIGKESCLVRSLSICRAGQSLRYVLEAIPHVTHELGIRLTVMSEHGYLSRKIISNFGNVNNH